MIVNTAVIHVLRSLGIEHVPGWVGGRSGCASRIGQIIVMPALIVPPQFVNVAVGPKVVHVLRALRIEHIPARIARSVGCASRIGQIIVMPALIVPPQFVNVAVGPKVVSRAACLAH